MKIVFGARQFFVRSVPAPWLNLQSTSRQTNGWIKCVQPMLVVSGPR
jgi:hypothetical protein